MPRAGLVTPERMERLSVQLLGAAGTVTGSKHLVTTGGRQILLDCGLFQGLKALRERNWAPFPFDPAKLLEVVKKVLG